VGGLESSGGQSSLSQRSTVAQKLQKTGEGQFAGRFLHSCQRHENRRGELRKKEEKSENKL